MALDVYVMPIWRFKVGDFRSPIERSTGFRPKVVTRDRILQRPRRASWLEKWRARRETAVIRRAVESANRTTIRWNDEGDTVYAEQSPGFESLRAFAKWLDCRSQFPRFDPPPEGNYYKHPVMATEIGEPSCRHLVGHSCFSGYFLPCEFKCLTEVEPYLIFGEWPATKQVGSTPRLVRELELVQSMLRVPAGYRYTPDEELAVVKSAYVQLREVAELSQQHGLPIIFWG